LGVTSGVVVTVVVAVTVIGAGVDVTVTVEVAADGVNGVEVTVTVDGVEVHETANVTGNAKMAIINKYLPVRLLISISPLNYLYYLYAEFILSPIDDRRNRYFVTYFQYNWGRSWEWSLV
jgi:hypothetical protein